MLFFSPESLAPGHTRVDSSYDSDLSLNVPFSEDPVLHDQFKIAYIYIYPIRQWHPTPVLLSGKSHGQRSLVGCNPWGHKELDMTEQLHFHFSLSCIGEGNGNPLQCSCLENPRDGGAWWAAVYGVSQSQTRLKRLSSSNVYIYTHICDIHIYVCI